MVRGAGSGARLQAVGEAGREAERTGVVDEGPAKLEKRLEPLEWGRGAEAEEQVIARLGVAAARVAEGDAAARVQPAALTDVDGRVAVELPAGVAVLGEE